LCPAVAQEVAYGAIIAPAPVRIFPIGAWHIELIDLAEEVIDLREGDCRSGARQETMRRLHQIRGVDAGCVESREQRLALDLIVAPLLCLIGIALESVVEFEMGALGPAGEGRQIVRAEAGERQVGIGLRRAENRLVPLEP
jgi:hypothetical protein